MEIDAQLIGRDAFHAATQGGRDPCQVSCDSDLSETWEPATTRESRSPYSRMIQTNRTLVVFPRFPPFASRLAIREHNSSNTAKPNATPLPPQTKTTVEYHCQRFRPALPIGWLTMARRSTPFARLAASAPMRPSRPRRSDATLSYNVFVKPLRARRRITIWLPPSASCRPTSALTMVYG